MDFPKFIHWVGCDLTVTLEVSHVWCGISIGSTPKTGHDALEKSTYFFALLQMPRLLICIPVECQISKYATWPRLVVFVPPAEYKMMYYDQLEESSRVAWLTLINLVFKKSIFPAPGFTWHVVLREPRRKVLAGCLTALQNCGIKNILIACVGDLRGFSDASQPSNIRFCNAAQIFDLFTVLQWPPWMAAGRPILARLL